VTVFIATAPLGGCMEGILDPRGPVAAAERQILLNSLAIMLAIVIPTIIAILAVGFWFGASNSRTRYLCHFDQSGLLEVLVWSIPAITVPLVGGVAWLGAHELHPRKALGSTVKPVTVQVVSLDWKWLFINSDEGIASARQWSGAFSVSPFLVRAGHRLDLAIHGRMAEREHEFAYSALRYGVPMRVR
jgi:cytochrome o ubiquinol oxidase subunit 2